MITRWAMLTLPSARYNERPISKSPGNDGELLQSHVAKMG
jgi:hypothetical protein